MKNLHIDDVERLLLAMEENNIQKLVVKDDAFKIKLKRDCPKISYIAAEESPISQNIIEEEPAKSDTYHLQNPNEDVALHASVVGTYHETQKLTVGDQVKAGQKLAYIDILKIKKEIVSPVNGIISQIHVEENSGVEYGELLLNIIAV